MSNAPLKTDPAIIEQADTTVVVPRDWHCSVAENGLLVLEPV
jgi:N-methylhydantoinase A/oxoprolinase/acetone carboxylase beta subunit